MPKLTFFTTDGCHLCEKALENIRLAQSLLPFQIEMIDIQDEYNTFQKYKDDIPVILVNGKEIGRHHIPVEWITKKIRVCKRCVNHMSMDLRQWFQLMLSFSEVLSSVIYTWKKGRMTIFGRFCRIYCWPCSLKCAAIR
ncbi:MAG: glutaredoxin family protein [Calditrichaeota bacterium]|nr:glutaredoxin family protein [Calditrichota bacterium]